MKRRLRRALAAGAACVLLTVPLAPVRAEWIVFDPRNFAQNVLTAARELQQVNNEIQSLENQAQMLINQARNLASLPYSALQQLEQSIAQTEQLLAQAQNIAYSVSSINQAFATTYPQSYPASTSATQLFTDAQTRWQNALNGFHQAMRVQAGAVQNLDTTRKQNRWSCRRDTTGVGARGLYFVERNPELLHFLDCRITLAPVMAWVPVCRENIKPSSTTAW